MKLGFFILLFAAILVLAGCTSETPSEPPPETTPSDMPETETVPEQPLPPTGLPSEAPSPMRPPPGLTFPDYTLPLEEVLASRFGIVDVKPDIGEINTLGIRWDRPHPGPFVWGHIEPEKGRYNWREIDEYLQLTQAFSFATLATIWPFAEWDQAGWGDAGDTSVIFEKELGKGRRKPHDMDAYRKYVSALVERYDGDGIDDVPGLIYPVKYWEAGNEPGLQEGFDTFFVGSPEDYLEVLKTTYQAVKEADPEAMVLHAGMAGPCEDRASFWRPVYEKGSDYFDIANIHSVEVIHAFSVVPDFVILLSEYSINKPIWVTEVQHSSAIGLEEHAYSITKSYISAFASGADRIFYTMFNIPDFAPEHHKIAALIVEGDKKRPGYYALKTMVSKLDPFTSVEKLTEGQYKFMVDGEPVYVLWGSGKIPEEITGEVLITDIYGEESRINSMTINLTDSPIFVEK
jgi:hypothetical protein